MACPRSRNGAQRRGATRCDAVRRGNSRTAVAIEATAVLTLLGVVVCEVKLAIQAIT